MIGSSAQPTIKDLTDKDFELLRALILEKSGISLNDSKKELLRTRLRSRLIKEGFASYTDFYKYVKNDKSEKSLVSLLDDISTNLTSFFREINHFKFLDSVLPAWIEKKEKENDTTFRIWSAGCSSGEEPYSLLITMLGYLADRPSRWRIKLLATDISTDILEKSTSGLYRAEKANDVPANIRHSFFTPENSDRGEKMMRVKKEYRDMISFRRFNLMREQFPFKNEFDYIFCRNVMIYFDRPTQEVLVAKYYKFLKRGGYLFIGHSESLTGLKHDFKYTQPTVYQKP